MDEPEKTSPQNASPTIPIQSHPSDAHDRSGMEPHTRFQPQTTLHEMLCHRINGTHTDPMPDKCKQINLVPCETNMATQPRTMARNQPWPNHRNRLCKRTMEQSAPTTPAAPPTSPLNPTTPCNQTPAHHHLGSCSPHLGHVMQKSHPK